MSKALFRLILAILLFGSHPCASALDPERRMDEFHHRIFYPRGDITTEVRALAQTPDGYIWVGTVAGLYRFDGASFELMSSLGGKSILNRPIVHLIAEPGGGLWIGYGGGVGSGYLNNGAYTAFSSESGWGSLNAGAIDGNGVAWLVLDGRLVRVSHLRPQSVREDWGLPDSAVREAVIDASGTVWVSNTGSDDLFYLLPGEKRFRWVGQRIGASLLCVAPDGTIFVSGASGLWAVTRTGSSTKVQQISKLPFSKIWIDRGGSVFATAFTKAFHVGDFRRLLAPGGEAALLADSFTPQKGIAGPAVVTAVLDDNEDNLWVASGIGLERFRSTQFTPLSLPGASFTFGLAAGENGALWAGNWNSKLMKIVDRSRISTIDEVGSNLAMIYRDPHGLIWASTPTGLWRSDANERFSQISVPPALLRPWTVNMTLDASDELWFQSSNLVRGSASRGGWHEVSTADGFDGRTKTRAMMTDSLGRVWLARGSTLIRVENGKPVKLNALSKALGVGAILTFAKREDRVWVGGLDGLAVVRGDKVLKLTVRDGDPIRQVSAIVETPKGELWVRGADDVWRIPVEELELALRENRSDVAVEHFDALDGVDSSGLNSKATMAMTSDGLIWVGTHQGVAWIDPDRLVAPAKAPALHIKSVDVDGVAMDTAPEASIPPLAHRLEIHYTAVELGYPERIRFRYKLEGVDDDWVFADTRRIAYYNDLAPGDYRFRLSSTDRHGHWREDDGITLKLIARAGWFQTPWFKLACAVLVVGVATLGFYLRMRSVAYRLRHDLDRRLNEMGRIATARQSERDRIARELHDTLLQSMYGVIWKFQRLINRLPNGDELKVTMNDALEAADLALEEGRQRVKDLRSAWINRETLVEQIKVAVDEIQAHPDVEFRSSTDGTNIELSRTVHAEVLAIATEAVRNAYRHGRSTYIALRIDYRSEVLRIAVTNDGNSISPHIARHGRAGHWGLAGMQERARKMGGDLDISSREGGGTVISLSVPATVAYTYHASFEDAHSGSRASDGPMQVSRPD